MNRTRVAFGLLTSAVVLLHLLGVAHAQSSLGIGANEASVPATGFFAGLLNWINVQQQGFYRSLTAAMKTMRETGSGTGLLVSLSFAYGVFHAAGPGHGKAVISSYMLANEVALRRGIMLSFVSAMLQAATAIVVMTLAFLVLRGTAVSMTDAAWFLEIVSYAAITAFGAWLVWKKARLVWAQRFQSRPAHSLSAASTHAHSHAPAHDHADAHHRGPHGHAHSHAASHAHSHHRHAGHAHAEGEVCDTCGHAHAPDPAALGGDRFEWRTAWSAIAAVGIRPCTGALIVLSFAFLNGLWAAGVLSVLAMALGTAITVSVLATLAVTAKNWAVAIAGGGRRGSGIHSAIELTGACLVLLLGAVLLAASLSA